MIDDLVSLSSARGRHRDTLFGPYLDDFLTFLKGQGYSHGARQKYLFTITRFGEYLRRRPVGTLTKIKPCNVRGFLKHELQIKKGIVVDPRRFTTNLKNHIQTFLDYFRTQGHHIPTEPRSTGPLGEFCTYLREQRGLQPVTIAGMKWELEKFLQYWCPGCDTPPWAQLTPEVIDRFLMEIGPQFSRSTTRYTCNSLRALCRYLFQQGRISRDISRSVMSPRFYALASLPKALPWETLQHVLKLPDTKTPKGLRDRAILWLLVTYGVRPGEVVKLCLEDIDWRHDTITFRRSKSGRPLTFPLTRAVGEAMLAYLKAGRPESKSRGVFLRVDAPHGPLVRGSAVSLIVRLYLTQTGVDSEHRGAGVIRHSLAVHLLQKGFPLKTITDMLGHQDPNTAYIYTKLAVEDLREVALSLEEVLT